MKQEVGSVMNEPALKQGAIEHGGEAVEEMLQSLKLQGDRGVRRFRLFERICLSIFVINLTLMVTSFQVQSLREYLFWPVQLALFTLIFILGNGHSRIRGSIIKSTSEIAILTYKENVLHASKADDPRLLFELLRAYRLLDHKSRQALKPELQRQMILYSSSGSFENVMAIRKELKAWHGTQNLNLIDDRELFKCALALLGLLGDQESVDWVERLSKSMFFNIAKKRRKLCPPYEKRLSGTVNLPRC